MICQIPSVEETIVSRVARAKQVPDTLVTTIGLIPFADSKGRVGYGYPGTKITFPNGVTLTLPDKSPN